jgi:uncharacterized membrane protein (UPF0127 family)|tara:strand:+ start:1287 stop:1742 length:456 start_codon:yes stop_codon:yes gene_type:complete
LIAWVGLFAAVSGAHAGCEGEYAYLSGSWGQVRFQVEVANSDITRAKGLMGRTSLPKFSGMIFIYDNPQIVSFWMKNTLLPLDVLYFQSDGRLLDIHEDTVPGSLEPLVSSGPVQFVLEINGGLSKTLNFNSDTVLNFTEGLLDKKNAACG